MVYDVGLGERLRARVEAMGRVGLTPEQLDTMAIAKKLHAGLVVVFVLQAVAGIGGGCEDCALLPLLVGWLGAICEAIIELVVGRATVLATLKSVGLATGGLVLSFVGMVGMLMFSLFGASKA